ncbi:MAG: PEP-CTERM sorting domain-containing protein [Planctomycetota bacterium]
MSWTTLRARIACATVLCAAVSWGLPTTSCHAGVTTLAATDSGFFNEAGRSSKNDGVILGATPATFNYSVGAIDEAPPLAGVDVKRRNYFTFDLSGVSEPIIGATLSAFNPIGGYGSPDATETYELFGAFASPPPSGSMGALASDLESVYSIFDAGELSSAMILYDEIVGGPGPIGMIEVSAADDGTFIEISLNPLGIDYLNTFSGGKVVIGGELSSLDGIDGGDEFLFGFSSPVIAGVVDPDPAIASPTPTPTLTLTTTAVPEPSVSFALCAGGLFLSMRRGRRRRSCRRDQRVLIGGAN